MEYTVLLVNTFQQKHVVPRVHVCTDEGIISSTPWSSHRHDEQFLAAVGFVKVGVRYVELDDNSTPFPRFEAFAGRLELSSANGQHSHAGHVNVYTFLHGQNQCTYLQTS